MDEPTLVQKIESYLFYEGGTASIKSIMHVTGATQDEVTQAVAALGTQYTESRGITLITTDAEVSLRVAKSCTSFIETIHKESLSKEVGPAALEVLGILLYRGKSSQAEIDTIRGVNSAFSLRTLRMRGLISRQQEGAQVTYVPTAEALAHLGVSSIDDIPNRKEILGALQAFESKATTVDSNQSQVGENTPG